MLSTDFIKHFWNKFEILSFDKKNLDITNIQSIDKLIKKNKSDIIINFAAYTNVEDAEDVGLKDNFDVNSLGVYNLSKISAKYNIDLITISTDYVFDGTKKEWYKENDIPNPINNYWMAKYLGERLANQENHKSIIIRTSWLYGWWKEFRNFVNIMLKLSKTKEELNVVNDQYWSPTYTIDLCNAIAKVIMNTKKYRWKILHFCNQTKNSWISRFEFAKEIFKITWTKIELVQCSSKKFITKAKRPKWTKLLNGSNIKLRNRKDALKDYLKRLGQ